MADTYTDSGMILPELSASDVWGDRVNDGVTDIASAMIGGKKTIAIGSSTTYTLAAQVDGVLGDSHYYSLTITGTPASAVTFTIPASVVRRNYQIKNSTGQTVTVKYAASTGVVLGNGDTTIVWCDGSEVYDRGPGYRITPAEIAALVTPTGYTKDAANVQRYGGVADNSTNVAAALANASLVSATAGGGNIIIEGGTFKLSTDTTIASGATIEFRQGGKISVDAGVTLRIIGSLIAPSGTQIFTGAGDVRFATSPAGTSRNTLSVAYPEWFGAIADGATSSTAAINSCILAVSTWGGKIQFTAGVYLSAGIVAVGGVSLCGVGKDQTIIKSTAAAPLVLLNNTVSIAEAGGFGICDLTLDGNSNGTIGFRVNNYSRFNIKDTKIIGFSDRGVYSHGAILWQLLNSEIKNCPIGFDADTDQSSTNLVTLRDVSINGSATWGLRCTGGSLLISEDCDLEGNGTSGNANTGAMLLDAMDTDGLGVAAIIKGAWMELNSGGAGIRITEPATSYATFIIDGTQCFGGTRTYGLDVVGTGTRFANISSRASVFQSATTDINIGENVSGGLDNVRSATRAIHASNSFLRIFPDPVSGNYQWDGLLRLVAGGGLGIPDGVTAPSTQTGYATIYVDTADGDLKVKFGDGTIKTIVTDT